MVFSLDISLISNYMWPMNRDLILFKIGRIQYKAHRFLLGELRGHGIRGIAPSHGEIIGFLILNGPMMMKDIARVIDKDKSTITALIDKLVAMGLVKKTRGVDDSRVSMVSLTKKGESMRGKYLDISARLRAKAYRGFTDGERESLSGLLDRLNGNL